MEREAREGIVWICPWDKYKHHNNGYGVYALGLRGGAGRLAELIGGEIIRRWLDATEPSLWRHKGEHYYWHELTKKCEWKDQQWVLKPTAPETASTTAEQNITKPQGEGE